MITNPNEKFATAMSTLKPNTEYSYFGVIETESDFNKINWVTGVDSNGWSITTTILLHFPAEMPSVYIEMIFLKIASQFNAFCF